MNPLRDVNIGNGLSPELMQNIKEVKGIMGMLNGNPQAIMQQNPMFRQVIEICNGKNPEIVFKSICKQKGIDADAFINALKN